MESTEHWRQLAATVAARNPWVVAIDVVQAAVERGGMLRDLGAPGVFCIGASEGTGSLDPSMPALVLGVRGEGMMGGIRAAERALDHVPDDVQAQVDAWDPTHAARGFRVFFSTGAPVAGRATFGARPAAWQALEDKTCIDALWAELGVPAAPHQVIEPTLAAMRAAWGTLDTGEGVVFSGDNREGFNGGASYVRWVRSEADLVDAQGFFVAGCDRVRAMPFLSGLPCSVHAFVAADQIAVFRPCEMLVFRRPSQSTFQYASVATFWEPGPDVTNAMRTLARTVAVGLRERFGYRGVFTIDGVLTPQGFLPTELNPRIGAGIALLFSGLDIPMELLHFAAIEGLELDWKLPELEGLVLANPRRVGRAGILVHNEVPPRKTGFDEVDGAFVETDREEPMFAVELGPAPGAAGFLRVVARSFPVGPAFGPVVVRLLRHLDAVWGLGIGPLEAGR